MPVIKEGADAECLVIGNRARGVSRAKSKSEKMVIDRGGQRGRGEGEGAVVGEVI